jgi:hypothetical protein
MTRVRVRGIAAVLATLAAATLATTAQSDARAATGAADAARHEPARTTLHIHVSGCDHCSVQLQQAIQGRPAVWQSRTQRVGDDHRARFRVPTRRTHGMSFVVLAPWAKGLDWVPNVATRYRGHDIDSFISRRWPATRGGRPAAGPGRG